MKDYPKIPGYNETIFYGYGTFVDVGSTDVPSRKNIPGMQMKNETKCFDAGCAGMNEYANIIRNYTFWGMK